MDLTFSSLLTFRIGSRLYLIRMGDEAVDHQLDIPEGYELKEGKSLRSNRNISIDVGTDRIQFFGPISVVAVTDHEAESVVVVPFDEKAAKTMALDAALDPEFKASLADAMAVIGKFFERVPKGSETAKLLSFLLSVDWKAVEGEIAPIIIEMFPGEATSLALSGLQLGKDSLRA